MFYYFRLILAVCFTFTGSLFGTKVVYLLSSPRSMSTMFVRMMEARGDFSIYNEPTVNFYARKYIEIYTPDWEWDDNFQTFVDVKKSIFSDLKKGNVFVKDMGFTSYESIMKDLSFVKTPSVHFLCLLRNPHEIALSIYGKVGKVIPNQSTMVGLKRLYEEYELLKKFSPNGVKIVFAEDLCNAPREVMQAYCDHLDIEFTEKMFTWKEHGENFDAHMEWHEQKKSHVTDHWHKRALETKSVGKRKTYALDKAGKPTFEEIKDLSDREQFKKFYEENLVYYEKFCSATEDHLINTK